MQINKNGYWENETAEGHEHDEGLAKALVNFFKREDTYDVLDVGCGDAYYTRFINQNEIFCMGVDGNPNTLTMSPDLSLVIADLSKPQKLLVYDWVLCLEVGEHIPYEYEDIFIGNLHRHNHDGIILSWSIPEYGGDGHVNAQPNEYIINRITSMGYNFDKESTDLLRKAAANYPEPCYWFSKTLMIFRKIKNDQK